MRVLVRWAAAALLVVSVTSCGTGQPQGPLSDAASAPSAVPAAAPSDPLALVGWWRVAGSPATVAVDPSALQVRDGCGALDAAWRADPGGLFLARPSNATPCPGGAGPAVPSWLTSAAGYRADGPDRVLTDGAGREVARLRPAPPGTPDGTVDPGRAPTPQERAAATQAAPAPAGTGGPGDVTGRWHAQNGPRAVVDLLPDGRWTGSDGCNDADGPWRSAPDGRFLAVAPEVTTLIACDGGAPLPTWLGTVRRVALDGPALVLYDVSGRPLGRLVR